MEYTKDNPLRTFTAFSGYDSQCLALKRLGIPFDLVGWSEIDKYAIEAHNVLFPEYADRNYGDISKIEWEQVPYFDLFTMSSPCQDFSVAGMQKGGEEGSGTRSSLLWECRKAILAKKPKYLLMENVKALLSAKFKPLFMKWQNELASYGYANFIKVLDAQDYGVPQHRERVFMVSILDDNASFHFPEPFPLERKLKDVLEKKVDEKYYLSEKLIKYVFSNGGKDNNIKGAIGICDKDDEVSPTLTAQYYKSSRQAAYLKESIKIVGNLYDGNKQGGRIYDAGGIAPTLDNMASGGNKSPKIIEPNFGNSRLNEMIHDNAIPSDEVVCVDTYNKSVTRDIFCTIKSNIDKENLKYIAEPLSCAIRGRNLGNGGSKWEQSLEIGNESANAITSVRKDSMVVEPNGNQKAKRLIKVLGNGKIRGFRDTKDKKGCSDFQIDNEESTALTVVSAHIPKCYGERIGFRIRKLTPREVFRLQDVDEADIDLLTKSGISNSQLYKLAGNSICVSVLYHIFRKLFIDISCESKQLSLF